MFINRMFHHNICDEELSPVVLRKPRLWGIPIKDKLHHFNYQKQQPYSNFPSILPCIFSFFSFFLLFFSFLLLFSFPLFLPSMRPLCPFFICSVSTPVSAKYTRSQAKTHISPGPTLPKECVVCRNETKYVNKRREQLHQIQTLEGGKDCFDAHHITK